MNIQGENIFNYITMLAADICSTPIAYVSEIQQNKVHYKGVTGNLLALATDLANSICETVLFNKQITVIEDTLSAEDAEKIKFNFENIRFFAGIPLISAKGVKLGTLSVMNTAPQKLNAKQIHRLALLACMATNEIENQRYAQAQLAQQKQQQNKLIHDIKNRSTTISLSTEIILAKTNEVEVVKRYATKIKNTTATIIENLNKIKANI